MIGKVSIPRTDGQGVVELVLSDELNWSSREEPGIADELNDWFGLILAEAGPADGDVAAAHVEKVASLLGGVAELEEKEPPDEGVVY